MRHKFITTSPLGNQDSGHHIFECEHCLQEIRINKHLWAYMVTTPKRLSDYYLKQIFGRITRCNPDRDIATIEIPQIPMCTVCAKRPVFEPGSSGIGGALCQVCYYDL